MAILQQRWLQLAIQLVSGHVTRRQTGESKNNSGRIPPFSSVLPNNLPGGFGGTDSPGSSSSSGSTDDNGNSDASSNNTSAGDAYRVPSSGGSGYGDYGPDMSGLSPGAIAGISIGSILAFFCLAGLLMWLCTRDRRRRRQMQGVEHLYQHSQAKDIDHHLGPLPPHSARSMHRRNSSRSDVTIAFAKTANVPVIGGATEDPPAYEETQKRHDDGHNYHGQEFQPDAAEFALWSVSNGFQQYSGLPPADDTDLKTGPSSSQAQSGNSGRTGG